MMKNVCINSLWQVELTSPRGADFYKTILNNFFVTKYAKFNLNITIALSWFFLSSKIYLRQYVSYFTQLPFLTSSVGDTKHNDPSAFSAIRIIPCDKIPLISRGAKFTIMLTF